MRTLVEHEEEVDSEITLNTTTLLGIFFGLVLVCGVFFGFGYSIGRRGTEAPNASNTPAANVSEDNPVPAVTHAPKPSAMESLQAADAAPSTSGTDTATEPQAPAPATSRDRDSQAASPAKPAAIASAAKSAPAVAKPELKPASLPVAPANTGAATLPAPATGGSAVMVQVAAVTHQEDANVLVSALRQRGYSVSVRNEPQDRLLHVQVGPFTTRETAKTMRAKLQADGYNAILKP
jgi:DedD protein